MKGKFEYIISKFNKGKPELIIYTNLGKSSHNLFLLEYEVNGDYKRSVLKAVPPKSRRYHIKEYNLKKEVEALNILRDKKIIKVPRVLYQDFSKKILAEDYFVMDEVIGKSMAEYIEQATSLDERMAYIKETATIFSKIHSANIEDFKFLRIRDYGRNIVEKFYNIGEKLRQDIKKEQRHLMEMLLKYLKKNYPTDTDISVINGDGAPTHFIRTYESDWCVLDWDPVDIGDRSWDLFWMLKGGISRRVFKVPDSMERLIFEYEEITKHKLKNKKFYYAASIAMAYAVGLFIVNNVLDHSSKEFIIKYLPDMESKIKNLI